LTMRKLGAALGILLIACEVLGRLYVVMIGIAPSTGGDAIKIVIGGLIALAVIGYVASQWKKFRLDRASGGGRRVEAAIVHEPVEFGAIPGNAQTL
jgi:hypothetical protein